MHAEIHRIAFCFLVPLTTVFSQHLIFSKSHLTLEEVGVTEHFNTKAIGFRVVSENSVEFLHALNIRT